LESGSESSQPNFTQNTSALLLEIALEGAFLRRQRTPQKHSDLSNPAQDTIGSPRLDMPAGPGAFGYPCCAL
jgi:hypothetical protein